MRSSKKTKIMVFGTFDVLHRGHLDFFKQARKLSQNPYLIVSVARDINVKRIKRHRPKNTERKRLAVIGSLTLVNKAVLGDVRNHLPHILKEKPRIIALGYDQKRYIKNLKTDLTNKGLNVKIIRLKAFKPNIYKSSKIKNENN